jgi:hypothetical protein
MKQSNDAPNPKEGPSRIEADIEALKRFWVAFCHINCLAQSIKGVRRVAKVTTRPGDAHMAREGKKPGHAWTRVQIALTEFSKPHIQSSSLLLMWGVWRSLGKRALDIGEHVEETQANC